MEQNNFIGRDVTKRNESADSEVSGCLHSGPENQKKLKMNSFFFNLTPDIILKALEQSGLEPTGHCMALKSFENRVYDLKLENGSHVVAKFYRPGRWSREQIKEEHDFLLERRADEVPG